jgi:hypothetical protein
MDAGRRCCGHLSLCLAISLKKKRAALKEEEKRLGTKCLVKVISPSYKKKTCAVIAQELGSLLVM